MGIDRRSFFKVLGVTGATLALGDKLNAGEKNGAPQEFYGVLYDSFMCGGCQTCEFTCAEKHGLPEPTERPELGVQRKLDHTRRTVVNKYEFEDGVASVKTQCMHCLEPACVSACLTQAMQKTKEGPVIWKEDKCMGCRYCMISCPFDVPKFEYHSPNPKIVKCDMCYDRLQEGEEPACVDICPNDALIFGKCSELLKIARQRILEYPDWYIDHIYGEKEAGGTCWMFNSQKPFDQVGFDVKIQESSYPELTKGFLYSVPSVFVLWPTILLGIHEATKNNNNKNPEEDE